MPETRVLNLIGSPRVQSTSEKLACYLTDDLAARGWQVETQQVAPALRRERWEGLEERIRAADIVVLAFPLYVDALPGELTQALERLASSYRQRPPSPRQRWLAIINCGFVEGRQNDIAVAICGQFAREAGVTWSGGLTIGGAGGLSGHDLDKMGGMVRHLTSALALVREALFTGVEIPAEAFQLARQRFCPPWLYFLMANTGMYLGAYHHHVLRRINARPYGRV